LKASKQQVIEPKIDAYGNRARSGALADYLEVNALLGRNLTAADLTDIATEQGWSRLKRRMILIEGDDLDSDPASWAQIAFSSIAERQDILGDKYPYLIDRGALEYAGNPDPENEPYLALLCLLVVHAWDLRCLVEPTTVLEATVIEVLLEHQLRVGGMGTGDRAGLNFVDNLRAGGQQVGLNPSANPMPRSASAKDAGVDTLATLLWPDGRQGQWSFIGQVTCESSLGWKKKLKEPEPETWRGYLQEGLRPRAFLAVPHHVDHRAWSDLMASQTGLLLDRLRLCLFKSRNSADEKALIRCVLECIAQ
jgi:hypothetical protein